MKTINFTISAFLLLFLTVINGLSQTNIQFTTTVATDEHAIQLTWTSTNGENYQIQYANALATNSDGSTAWATLYDNYPSQGTNTLILDTGDYTQIPAIPHPKNSSMRFYRILDKGADSLADAPIVTVSLPTNGATVSGELTIVVTAATDQPVLSYTKLLVDGEEQPRALSSTNYNDGTTNYLIDTYTINTCEWGNGTHTLFGIAQNANGNGDDVSSGTIQTANGVSPFVDVYFNNLVTRISFSQPAFNPDAGQTQQVTAYFPLNSDWTLRITDLGSNVVRTFTGSGNIMVANWDGNDDGGTNLPVGVYFYYVSAQTNGLANEVIIGGGGNVNTNLPPGPGGDSEMMWAANSDDESVAPLAIYPPGIDTNNLIIFSATPSEVRSLHTSSRSSFTGGGFTPSVIVPITPLPDPQDAPQSPQRHPNYPIRGYAGTFGIAYDTFIANGTGGFNLAPLDNGLHAGQHIPMNTYSAGTTLNYKQIQVAQTEAKNFIGEMSHWGWNNTLNRSDDKLNINDLRGSGSPYNNVNLAVYIGHGVYGNGNTALDYAANQCKQMYFPITAGGGAQYLRLSEMNLGGAGTNGLKWMALLCCDSLHRANWSNMQSKSVHPYNSNLHLLLGTDSTSYINGVVLWYWSRYINYGSSTNYSPMTIRAAWYQAARDAYKSHTYPNTISFIVAGASACSDDTLQTNSTPGGSWFLDTSTQVWP